MNIKAELRIYGVDYYYGTLKVSDDLYAPTMSEETSDNEKGELYQDDNGIRLNEFSIEQIGRLSDEVFILEAEEHGNVWSLGSFLEDSHLLQSNKAHVPLLLRLCSRPVLCNMKSHQNRSPSTTARQ